MRAPWIYALLLLLALMQVGCSGVAPTASPTSPSISTPTPVPSAIKSPAASPKPATPTVTSSNAAASAAVTAVIQRANEAQQEAFAKQDPTIMKDTATADYYDELVQINGLMAINGISAIKLVKIEWGPVVFPDSTTAKTTTYETWRTTFADGSTDERRERNDYTLVLVQGSWKIQFDDNPGSHPPIAPNL